MKPLIRFLFPRLTSSGASRLTGYAHLCSSSSLTPQRSQSPFETSKLVDLLIATPHSAAMGSLAMAKRIDSNDRLFVCYIYLLARKRVAITWDFTWRVFDSFSSLSTWDFATRSTTAARAGLTAVRHPDWGIGTGRRSTPWPDTN